VELTWFIICDICLGSPKYISTQNYILANKRRKKGYSGTGYPWEVTPEEVVDIFKKFPKTYEESISSKFTFPDIFSDKDVRFKMHIDANLVKDRGAFLISAKNKFKYLSQYLLKHPSLITPYMNDVIKDSELLRDTFIIRNAVLTPATVDKPSELTISQDNTDTPLAKLELTRMEITEKLLDKASLALDYMTPLQIQKASIGTKAKMVENMIKAYTMFKGEGSSPSFTKININNMNVLQARELSRRAAEQ
jgi:hypothetical protein